MSGRACAQLIVAKNPQDARSSEDEPQVEDEARRELGAAQHPRPHIVAVGEGGCESVEKVWHCVLALLATLLEYGFGS